MEIKQKDIKRYEEITEELDELMQEIRSYNGEANLYVPMTKLCLMEGCSHSYEGLPIFKNCVSEKELGYISGGEW